MAVIFNAVPGSAIPVAVRTDKAALTVFSINGNSSPVSNAVTNSVQLQQKVGAQFKKSLNRVLYAHAFGDEPSEISVSFFIFARDCEGNPLPGMQDMLRFYQSVKFRPNSQEPLQLVIGGQPLFALCLGMTLSLTQQGPQFLSQGSLQLIGWSPEDT